MKGPCRGKVCIVPIWLLFGSSDFPSAAGLAAELACPSPSPPHFGKPDYLHAALQRPYRRHFQPSEALAEPRVMVGAGVVVAETDAEARRLFTSVQQQFALSLVRGMPGQLPPPVDSMDDRWSAPRALHVEPHDAGVGRRLADHGSANGWTRFSAEDPATTS